MSFSASSFGSVEDTPVAVSSPSSSEVVSIIGPTASASSSQNTEYFSAGIHGTQIETGTIPADRLEP